MEGRIGIVGGSGGGDEEVRGSGEMDGDGEE